MPNSTVLKVSKACGKDLKDVEELFLHAEEIAKNQNKKNNCAYIMDIFKKSLGKECLDKLNWSSSEVKESDMLTNIRNLILESKFITIYKETKLKTKDIKLKICEELIKNEIVQDNIRRFNLKNDAKEMCKTLKIDNVRDVGQTLEITILPINEKSTNGYLGEHTCYVEGEHDFSKFYNISLDG
jgi:hypothetical protein